MLLEWPQHRHSGQQHIYPVSVWWFPFLAWLGGGRRVPLGGRPRLGSGEGGGHLRRRLTKGDGIRKKPGFGLLKLAALFPRGQSRVAAWAWLCHAIGIVRAAGVADPANPPLSPWTLLTWLSFPPSLLSRPGHDAALLVCTELGAVQISKGTAKKSGKYP